jgi:hypothetical protein
MALPYLNIITIATLFYKIYFVISIIEQKYNKLESIEYAYAIEIFPVIYG